MHRVPSAGNTGASARPRKERRLTYVVRTSNENTHCSGINTLQVVSTRGGGDEPEGLPVLFSGSRDGTIRRWELEGPEARCAATFESHVDWVNDMVVVAEDVLVSCSSDTTIKTWRAFSSGECTRTLRQHSDYVTSLAASPDTKLVASGGLGGEVFLWDMEAAMAPVAKAATQDSLDDRSSGAAPMGAGYGSMGGVGPGRPAAGLASTASIADRTPIGSAMAVGGGEGGVSLEGGYVARAAKGHKESVYTVAMNHAGTVLVSGGTEKALRVWDPRTGTKQWKLKGHTENVKTLLLDPSGRYCVSGSSDSIIRLWDVGQQRCIHSYAVHTDSVWALAGNPASNIIYSGGRDGCVYRTDLASRGSVLLAKEKDSVLSLALQGREGEAEAEGGWIWAATTTSSLHKWPASELGQPEETLQRSFFTAGSLGLARVRASMDGSALPVPLCSTPLTVIPGSAGIVQHSIMNDRRHVLTKDTDEVVKLWEITRGAVIENFGQVSFEEKEKELFEKVSVPSWFTMDTRLGSIAVHLDTPQCFSAEMYAVDCGVEGASEDLKLNLGHHTLRGLLEHWWTGWQARPATTQPPIPNGDAPHGMLPEAPSESSMGASRGEEGPGEEAALAGVLPAFQFSRTCPPSIITEGSHGGPWRRKATELDGSEGHRDLPRWCMEAVLYDRLPPREPAKCSFFLLPLEGSPLAPLAQGKLSAPRILRIHKVMNYVVERLGLERSDEDENVPEPSAAPSGSQAANGHPPSQGTPPLRPWQQSSSCPVEILCNDEVLSPEMSLATVRAYVWRKPEDLALHYRTAQPRMQKPS